MIVNETLRKPMKPDSIRRREREPYFPCERSFRAEVGPERRRKILSTGIVRKGRETAESREEREPKGGEEQGRERERESLQEIPCQMENRFRTILAVMEEAEQ